MRKKKKNNNGGLIRGSIGSIWSMLIIHMHGCLTRILRFHQMSLLYIESRYFVSFFSFLRFDIAMQYAIVCRMSPNKNNNNKNETTKAQDKHHKRVILHNFSCELNFVVDHA